MDISVIVPIYKGNQYIPAILDMIRRNVSFAQENGTRLEVELLLVNDFPSEPIVLDPPVDPGYEIRIFENERNEGIHASRVHGLSAASGSYILFLDQDDEITEDCLLSQYKAIQGHDVVIGNGLRGIKNQYRKIYRSKGKQKLSCKEKYYIKAANQIVSPGHCLIRKEAIPNEWYEYIMTDNGGDDLFLWFLMFEGGKSFCTNDKCIYKHVETGNNCSNDRNAMYRSSDNIIRISKECQVLPEKKLKQYKRRIAFLKKMQNGSALQKAIACMKNLDICILKVYAFYK